MNMEPYVVCKDCGEKTSTNFAYCGKCRAELPLVKKIHQSAQETVLPASNEEEKDMIQLPSSSDFQKDEKRLVQRRNEVKKSEKFELAIKEEEDSSYVHDGDVLSPLE